MKQKQSVSVGI